MVVEYYLVQVVILVWEWVYPVILMILQPSLLTVKILGKLGFPPWGSYTSNTGFCIFRKNRVKIESKQFSQRKAKRRCADHIFRDEFWCTHAIAQCFEHSAKITSKGRTMVIRLWRRDTASNFAE